MEMILYIAIFSAIFYLLYSQFGRVIDQHHIFKLRHIREDTVLERWTAFLTNQVGSGEEFLQLVESELDARDCPYRFYRVTFLSQSHSREFVCVKLNYSVSAYIGFEQVGKDIHLNWLINEKLSFLFRLRVLGPMLHRIFHRGTFIDRNRVLAFAAFTKNCVENVFDSIMDKYNLDKTRLVRQSSGKLGPF